MILNRNTLAVTWATLVALLMTSTAQGAPLGVPYRFTSGTPAVAAEVNANFDAVIAAVGTNDSRIAALESALATLQATVSAQATTISDQATAISNQAATIASLESQLTAINTSNVMALDTYLTVDTVSDPRGPLVQLSGVNLQVVNGQGSTMTANGLGNLIIGYDETENSGIWRCTVGWYSASAVPTNSTNCASAGGSWTRSGFKSGSHYLVTGSQNNYSRWGGLLTGYRNTSNYDYASVCGGDGNTASGSYASVSGGYFNTASGLRTAVSGGWHNTASGNYASISGGYGNNASEQTTSVSAGYLNTASGQFASISGGAHNIASGLASSVSGGGSTVVSSQGNTAATTYSSILGGLGQTTTSTSQTLPALP